MKEKRVMKNKTLLYTVINEINDILKNNNFVNPETVSLKLTEILTEKEIDVIKEDFKEEKENLRKILEKNNASINNVPDTIISGIMLGGKENVDNYLSEKYKEVADYVYENVNLSQYMPKNNPQIISLISNNKELQKQLSNIHLNEEKLITAHYNDISVRNNKSKSCNKKIKEKKIKL
tara:strand:- start:46203 stop:46736 length:534 start_codon:yes stop_codon:yes gene_type:complete